ncbi:MAG: dTMP kinase [Woeseiaceae bacterium]|jgi:dTMP kinase|tara:strand:+ start:51890 stop:52516 length:627 start_codon:yes stop_codon:yes gene_type:complete
MNMTGKFITIEGSEGVGKSTNIEFISNYLKSKDITTIETREPGGTKTAEEIRRVLLNTEGETVPEIAELLLFFAARSFHVENLIKPAINQGHYVICDRFSDATIAYQGYGRGFDVKDINIIAAWVQKKLQPDLTILLDAPAEIGMQRAKNRGSIDRMETEDISFYERVRQGYLELANEHKDRFVVIDASQSLKLVQAEILFHLDRLLE